MKIAKILFPCDLTENATKILPYVLTFAEKYDSTVYLLHVVEDLQKWGFIISPTASMKTFQKEALAGAEKALDKVCEEQLQSCPNFQRRIVLGDPATEILKAIESEEMDLVIMGTHGRKGLESTIFGSVAENVVKRSSVPVLTINPWVVN
jgi:nucleotide-binding universal stress UspA family protein